MIRRAQLFILLIAAIYSQRNICFCNRKQVRELRFKLASEPAVPFDVDKSRGEESFPFFFFFHSDSFPWLRLQNGCIFLRMLKSSDKAGM